MARRASDKAARKSPRRNLGALAPLLKDTWQINLVKLAWGRGQRVCGARRKRRERRGQRGIDRYLSSIPQGAPVGNNLKAPVIEAVDREVDVRKA